MREEMNLDTLSEVYRTLQLLGAPEGFLQLMGEWGNGRKSADVALAMRQWNEDYVHQIRCRINLYETSAAMYKA